MAVTLAAPSKAAPAPSNGGTAAPAKAAPIPFTRAATRKGMLAFQVQATLSASALVSTGPIDVPPAGFLEAIDLEVQISASGNAAAVAFQADAPFNAIGYISLNNSAGDAIITTITGYHLYLINKYGGYFDVSKCDPKSDPTYSVTTGSGANGGSAHFILRVPLEIDPRDAFCAVPNLAANRNMQLAMQFNTTGNVYSTAPTAAPTITVTAYNRYWSQPSQTNGAGAPQATQPDSAGSVSLWRLESPTVSPGAKGVNHKNIGNVLRTWIYVLRTAAGARTDSDWPSIANINFNNDMRDYLGQNYWKSQMAKAYNLGGAAESAGGLDNGVYVFYPTLLQHGYVDVDGPRDQWLVTVDSTLLQFYAQSFGANASTLEILTNEVKPTSSAALYSLNVV